MCVSLASSKRDLNFDKTTSRGEEAAYYNEGYGDMNERTLKKMETRRRHFSLDTNCKQREMGHAIPVHIQRMQLARLKRQGKQFDEGWSVLSRKEGHRSRSGRRSGRAEVKNRKHGTTDDNVRDEEVIALKERMHFLKQSFEARMRQLEKDSKERIAKALEDQKKKLLDAFEAERESWRQEESRRSREIEDFRKKNSGESDPVVSSLRSMDQRLNDRDEKIERALRELKQSVKESVDAHAAATLAANKSPCVEDNGYVVFLVENEDVHVDGAVSMVRLTSKRARETLSKLMQNDPEGEKFQGKEEGTSQ